MQQIVSQKALVNAYRQKTIYFVKAAVYNYIFLYMQTHFTDLCICKHTLLIFVLH